MNLIIKEKNKRIEEESKEKVIIAYITAMWAAQWFSKKRPDPLEKILKEIDGKKKREMTAEELLAQVKNLNAIFGGEVKSIGN